MTTDPNVPRARPTSTDSNLVHSGPSTSNNTISRRRDSSLNSNENVPCYGDLPNIDKKNNKHAPKHQSGNNDNVNFARRASKQDSKGRPGPANWRSSGKAAKKTSHNRNSSIVIPPAPYRHLSTGNGRPGPSNREPTCLTPTGTVIRTESHTSRPGWFKRNQDKSRSHDKPTRPCFYFQRHGECKFGSRCRYSHDLNPYDPNPGQSPPPQSSKNPKASENVRQYLKTLQRLALRRRGVPKLHGYHDVEMWRAAWAAVAVGASAEAAQDLLRLLLRLPASSNLSPGGEQVVKVCLSVVRSLNAGTQPAQRVVEEMELVADVVKGRLIGKGVVTVKSVEVVGEMKVLVHGTLMRVMADMKWVTKSGAVLAVLVGSLEKLIQEAGGKKETAGDEDENEVGWKGLHDPTLEWLMGEQWLSPRPMTLQYETVVEYADTLQGIITMLAFYWGASAVFPRCRIIGKDGKFCDQPMVVRMVGGRNLRCSGRVDGRAGCNADQVWRCARKGHDGVCGGCLKKAQANLIGPPGPRASTDVYDAVVERETFQRGGEVYVTSHLASRKPPQVSPNWRTTYRLNCSALIGVLRLSASCEPLPPHSKIYWAEVVPVRPQEGFGNDYAERKRGRLAFRLLGRTDLPILNSDPEPLQVGQRIAIIDLRVFVPEIISVVSALTDSKLKDHLNNIRFVHKLIGEGKGGGEIPTTFDEEPGDRIRKALDRTDIELFTKLPAHVKLHITEQIISLVRDATLDRTQLAAFEAGLSSSLHCTQGPPGTGKSYLGVILIRALDIIREGALEAGLSVGPIVVLSYKNHSLDEILMDLLKSNQINSGLIRCGRPENEQLEKYAEKTSYMQRSFQETLTARSKCLRAARRFSRGLCELRSLFRDNCPEVLDEWNSGQEGGYEGIDAVVARLIQAMRLYCSGVGKEKKPEEKIAYSVLHEVTDHSEDFTPTDQSVIEVISGICINMEHWIPVGSCRVKFLLRQWLLGVEPPPRCAAFKEDGCVFQSNAPGAYCEALHKCLYPGCRARRVRGKYCTDHTCTFIGNDGELCFHSRLQNSAVCHEHACSVCVRIGCVEVQAKVGMSCKDHSCRDPNCDEGFVSPLLPYCQFHTCLSCQFLAGENPHEVKLVHTVEGSKFCAEHKCGVRGCPQERVRNLDAPQSFCVDHGCLACEGTRKCVDRKFPESRFCTEHRCAYNYYDHVFCDEKRWNGSIFCKEHTCRFCSLETTLVVNPVEGMAPRNVCAKHPLCANINSDGGTCNNRVRGESQYCDVHMKRVSRRYSALNHGSQEQCCGIAKRTKKRCKTQGFSVQGKFYCPAHVDQILDHNTEENEKEDGHAEVISTCDESDTLAVGGFASYENVLELKLDGGVSKKPPLNNKCGEGDGAKLSREYFGVKEGRDPPRVGGSEKDDTKIVSGTGDELENASVEALATERPAFNAALDLKNESTDVIGKRNRFSGNKTAVTLEQIERSEMLGEDLSPVENPEPSDFADWLPELYMPGEEMSSNSEECIPGRLQHLRDIVGDGSTESSDYEKDIDVLNLVATEDLPPSSMENLSDWCWGIPLPRRYRLVADFLGGAFSLTSSLIAIADSYVEAARLDMTEAASFTYKQARVVGSTVVGATRRLRALRASEPFAMLVEEACEVMEPVLVSVLSVPSVQKIEMIGDHRQLPAFVQPCWFNLQMTYPSIKISLFERLIRNNSSICSVLDVQRRMRPEISDLTRYEYQDIVQIKDHDCTRTQRVADRFAKELRIERPFATSSRIESVQKLWGEEGNFVPGVLPQVFFWDLKTVESRAAVGLSRCNEGESEACVALVEWLVRCGIPGECVTVLTPYKGQQVTVSKALQELHSCTGLKVKPVHVSTVDRYQGDENDIIILSLVCTRPGNLFLALRNRFIVATSRARMGFFMVGSSGALIKSAQGGDGPSHWRRLLADLRQGFAGGSDDHRAEPRIGSSLTICCPRHPVSLKDISKPRDFPRSKEELSSFCNEPCSFILPWCGHKCDRQCHDASTPHTVSCKVLVQRPCQIHSDVPLACHQLEILDNSASETMKIALESFRCDVQVQYSRPECPHVIDISCFDEQEIIAGARKLEECAEPVDDFVNPMCGHRMERPSCSKRRRWEVTPPTCMKTVVHQRPCGCKTRMSCHASIKESSLIAPSRCLEAVEVMRPRCSHSMSLRCYEGDILRKLWSEQGGESVRGEVSVVESGVKYGPSESELVATKQNQFDKELPSCSVRILYRRTCGHEMMALCADAFQMALGSLEEPTCRQLTSIKSPLCGHDIIVECNAVENIRRIAPSVFAERKNVESGRVETFADEKEFFNISADMSILKKLKSKCAGSVVVMRSCGHLTDPMHCARLYSALRSKKLPNCKVEVAVKRSCGHSYRSPCHLRGEPSSVCRHPVDDVFVFPSCRHGHSVRTGTCARLETLKASEYPQCTTRIHCTRYRCSHVVEVECHLEQGICRTRPGHRAETENGNVVVKAHGLYCEAESGVRACVEPVTYRRPCGHEEIGMPCHKAFELAAGNHNESPCRTIVTVASALCHHPVEVECCLSDSILSANPWGSAVPSRITTDFEKGEETTSPLIVEGRNKPIWSSVISNLKCGRKSRLQRVCGHEEEIPCEMIFEALESKCTRLEQHMCSACGHVTLVPCHDLVGNPDEILCRNIVEKQCTLCRINASKVECYRKQSFCNQSVSCIRSCGHRIHWTCGMDDDPRIKPEGHPCLVCLRNRWDLKLAAARAIIGETGGEKNKTDLFNLAKEKLGLDMTCLLDDLRARVGELVPWEIMKGSDNIVIPALEGLLTAYVEVVQINLDLLSQAVQGIEDMELDWKAPPELGQASECYDIVFKVLGDKQEAKSAFRLIEDQFGFGVRATLLSMETLKAEVSKVGGDGSLSICVGAAFRHQDKKGIRPFRSSKGDIKHLVSAKKKMLNDIQKHQVTANQLAMHVVHSGYDCATIEESQERVYWVAGTVFPILRVDIQLTVQCVICLEDMLPVKTWKCSKGHEICRVCFEMHVQMAKQPGSVKRSIDENGNVLCPQDHCGVAYQALDLISQAHDVSYEELKKIHDELEYLRSRAQSEREIRLALEQQKQKMQAEFQRIQSIQDLDERQAETIRMDIIDNILTLRCPREDCRMAFLDFTGCFALTCANKICGVHFCAWCITHYSYDDVHSHVARCPEGDGTLFHSFELFENHHRKRAKRLVLAKLRKLSTDVARRVLTKVGRELYDKGIQISERDL